MAGCSIKYRILRVVVKHSRILCLIVCGFVTVDAAHRNKLELLLMNQIGDEQKQLVGVDHLCQIMANSDEAYNNNTHSNGNHHEEKGITNTTCLYANKSYRKLNE